METEIKDLLIILYKIANKFYQNFCKIETFNGLVGIGYLLELELRQLLCAKIKSQKNKYSFK